MEIAPGWSVGASGGIGNTVFREISVQELVLNHSDNSESLLNIFSSSFFNATQCDALKNNLENLRMLCYYLRNLHISNSITVTLQEFRNLTALSQTLEDIKRKFEHNCPLNQSNLTKLKENFPLLFAIRERLLPFAARE